MLAKPKDTFVPYPTVKDAHEFRYEIFSFVDTNDSIALSSGSSTMCVPKRGRYLDELKRIFREATDIVASDLLKTPAPFPTGASLWDTKVLQELTNGAKVPSRNEETLKGAEPETLLAADALVAFKIYRLALKSMKPDILRKYHTITAPAAAAELAAQTVTEPSADMVPFTREFAHSFRQIVAVLSDDKDRYVKLSDAAYDEYAAVATELGCSQSDAKAVIDGVDAAKTVTQIGKGKKFIELVDKYKLLRPALISWQPRHVEEAKEAQSAIKARILVAATKASTDKAPIAGRWVDDALHMMAHQDVAEQARFVVGALLEAPLPEIKGYRLTVK